MTVKSMSCCAERRINLATWVLAAIVAGNPADAEPARSAVRQAPLTEAARLIASVQNGRHDVPRVELAARLETAGLV